MESQRRPNFIRNYLFTLGLAVNSVLLLFIDLLAQSSLVSFLPERFLLGYKLFTSNIYGLVGKSNW